MIIGAPRGFPLYYSVKGLAYSFDARGLITCKMDWLLFVSSQELDPWVHLCFQDGYRLQSYLSHFPPTQLGKRAQDFRRHKKNATQGQEIKLRLRLRLNLFISRYLRIKYIKVRRVEMQDWSDN